PFAPYQQIRQKMQKENANFADAVRVVREQYIKEKLEREAFNKQFKVAADFRNWHGPQIPAEVRPGEMPYRLMDCQFDGHGLREPPMHGDFMVAASGGKALSAILPPGVY